MWFRLKQSLDFEKNSWTSDACRGDRMRPDHHKVQELWETGWSKKSQEFSFSNLFEDHAVLLHIWGVQRAGDLSPRLQNFGGTQNYPCGPYALNMFIFFTVLIFTFWPRQRFFLLFWPRQMALWEKQRLESLRSCFSLFGELEYSKNGVSLISSLQVLSSLHFWIIKFILHIEIFRPTGLFKN